MIFRKFGMVFYGAVLIALSLPGFAQQKLLFDNPVSGEIILEDENVATYIISVPPEAVALSVDIVSSPVDLDIYMRHATPMEDWDNDAEHLATSEDYREGIRINRAQQPALKSGIYHIDVAYTGEIPVTLGKRHLDTIPFTLQATVIRTRIDDELREGMRLKSSTNHDSGYFRTFTIDVPRDAKALRIDLDEVDQDLDIEVRHGKQIVDSEDIEHGSWSVLGRETLLLSQNTTPELKQGRWFVNVVDYAEQGETSFSIYASFEDKPPPASLSIPPFPTASTDLERAIHSTVQILGDEGSGSGSLLSADGLILTNYHVVEKLSGGVAASGELVIGMTIDVRRPSSELFRARIVVADEALDLALIEITEGLYGQPIPPGYKFPSLKLGNTEKLNLGSPVTVIGYPGIGGTKGRTSVTLSRGVVSGFEYSDQIEMIKTDATISSGNSGGVAVDGSNQLIGVPTEVAASWVTSGQVGFIRSIDNLPSAWLELIKKRAANL